MNTASLSVRLAALLLATTAAAVSADAAPTAPSYTAGITITPDFPLLPGESISRVGYPLFGDSPTISGAPLDYRLTHLSGLGTGTIGNAYAGPENNGTLRVSASTNDEEIGAVASIGYIFQLRPKAGAVVPTAIPLHVFALGATGSEGFSSARIAFSLNYFESATSARSILEDTGVASSIGSSSTFGGNGNINIDEDITAVLNRDIYVSLFAGASAGFGFCCSDPAKDQYGTGTAYLDPVFTLPEEYRDLVDIVGLPQGDVIPPPSGTGAVPEPATWGMMILGLGAVGTQMRRRRQTRASFAGEASRGVTA